MIAHKNVLTYFTNPEIVKYVLMSTVSSVFLHTVVTVSKLYSKAYSEWKYPLNNIRYLCFKGRAYIFGLAYTIA